MPTADGSDGVDVTETSYVRIVASRYCDVGCP